MPKVIIVTTMWSKVGEKEGTEREELLKREVWGDILGKGFSVKRFDDTHQSAWDIVGDTVEKGSGVPLLVQEEMGDDRKPLNATKAAIHLKETTEKVPKGLLKNMRRGFLWSVILYIIVSALTEYPFEGFLSRSVDQISEGAASYCMPSARATVLARSPRCIFDFCTYASLRSAIYQLITESGPRRT